MNIAHDFLTEDAKLRHLNKIVKTEAFGSWPFYIQFICFIPPVVASQIVFGTTEFSILFVIYVASFVAEKKIALYGLLRKQTSFLKYSLLGTACRVVSYDLIAILAWSYEDAVFRMATMVMIASSLLNLAVRDTIFVAQALCRSVPHFLLFVFISYMVFDEKGMSLDFIVSAILTLCILPYFVLNYVETARKTTNFHRTKQELLKSQRVEAMGQLASGVSHDFNNILGVISGSLSLLEDTTDEKERRELINVAKTGVERGSALTTQLLAMGRKASLIAKPVNLNLALEHVQTFISRVLPANITLELCKSPDNPIALVDAGMLQNAVLNLALNSKSAMPNGGKLWIEVKQVPAPEGFPLYSTKNGSCAVVAVRDDGSGIPLADQQHVFEPFYSKRKSGEGSGLGLSMVRGFAQQSDGSVAITSEVGAGTEVSIYLPLITDANLDPQEGEDDDNIASEAPTTKTILLVEDDVHLLPMLEKMLRLDQHEVVTASTADDGMTILGTQRIDLLITDLVLPGRCQGADLIRYAKATNIKTLAISGYSNVKASDGNVLAEADEFLEKPFSLNNFANAVNGIGNC